MIDNSLALVFNRGMYDHQSKLNYYDWIKYRARSINPKTIKVKVEYKKWTLEKHSLNSESQEMKEEELC